MSGNWYYLFIYLFIRSSSIRTCVATFSCTEEVAQVHVEKHSKQRDVSLLYIFSLIFLTRRICSLAYLPCSSLQNQHHTRIHSLSKWVGVCVR